MEDITHIGRYMVKNLDTRQIRRTAERRYKANGNWEIQDKKAEWCNQTSEVQQQQEKQDQIIEK